MRSDAQLQFFAAPGPGQFQPGGYQPQTLVTGQTGTFYGNSSYDLWGGQASLPQDVIGNTLNVDIALGMGVEELWWYVALSGVTGPGASIQVQFLQADDMGLQTNAAVIAPAVQSAAVAVANIASPFLSVRLKAVGMGYLKQRFIGASYTVSGAPLTGGTIWGGIVATPGTSYPTV